MHNDLAELLAAMKARERELDRDPQRPQFHLLPPGNWSNDPNGPIQINGVYHVFYQHNPRGAFHADMHWGHARSTDLVHWEHLPIALAPEPGSYDQGGIWSGCCVDNAGTPTILYTGVKPQVQCLATGDADLVAWTKHAANPVLAAPPDVPGLTSCWRDPFAWLEDDGWYMVIGSGFEGRGGAALLYHSRDLLQWEYLHPLCTAQDDATGASWECPNFFPLGDRWVLTVAALRKGNVPYFIGRYEDHRFTPARQGLLDLGNCFYAPTGLLDDEGRRVLWGWSWEKYEKEALKARGWNGVLTLPREYFLHDDGALGMRPVVELQTLRRDATRRENVAVAAGASVPLAGVRGDQLELLVAFAPGEARRFGLLARRSPDGEEETRIVYDMAAGTLTVDAQRASLDDRAERFVTGGPVALSDDGTLTLHVFLDRSILEVFANVRAALTTRIYPSRRDSLGVAFFADGGAARVVAAEAWRMAGIRA